MQHLSSLGILGIEDALSAGPDFLGAVGILHATNERADFNSRRWKDEPTPAEPPVCLQAHNISILYGRTKETFSTCFKLQGLSALLDIHMKIIASLERDFLAKGSIPVTREYQPLQRKKQHQTPVCRKVITEPQLEKEATSRRPPRRSVHNTHHS